MRIDLNCDLGEGTGFDTELMPLVTSANIACGGHAGDEPSMAQAIVLAMRHRVAIGAHPGFNDREHFGRREIAVVPEEVFQLVLSQTRALQRVARPLGARVHHVKPHGALYSMAARNTLLADAVAQAVYEADPRLVLFGLAGSQLLAAARRCGLDSAAEAFADRAYEADGRLAPRGASGSVIEDVDAAVAQAIRIVREGVVRATDGSDLALRADTMCVHGDGRNAVELARRIRTEFGRAGVQCRAPGQA